jgi:hypothetical protein
MKNFSFISFLFIWSVACLSQTRSQSYNEPRAEHYVSVSGGNFFRINNKINSVGDRQLFKHYNVPGILFGVDYTWVGVNGFTVGTGFHYQILPVSFRFNIEKGDMPDSWTPNIDYNEKHSSYSLGNFYIPVQLGYTLEKHGWGHSFTLGINASRLTRALQSLKTSYNDNSGNRVRVFQLNAYTPKDRLWRTYKDSGSYVSMHLGYSLSLKQPSHAASASD